jgi:hypothetical protein
VNRGLEIQRWNAVLINTPKGHLQNTQIFIDDSISNNNNNNNMLQLLYSEMFILYSRNLVFWRHPAGRDRALATATNCESSTAITSFRCAFPSDYPTTYVYFSSPQARYTPHPYHDKWYDHPKNVLLLLVQLEYSHEYFILKYLQSTFFF